MPWPLYAGMTEEDLGAIYDYLRTVKPIKNKVVHFPDADQRRAWRRPMKRSLLAACLLLSTAALAGGTVTGKATFTGHASQPAAVNSDADPACKGARDEAVLLGKDGKALQNVLVRVVDPAASSRAPHLRRR